LALVARTTVAASWTNSQFPEKRPNPFHSLLLLSICCCGWLRFSIHLTPTFPDHLFEQQVFFQGTVDYDPAAERPSTSYYITGSVQLRVSSDRTKSADPVSKRTRLLVKFRQPVEMGYGHPIQVFGTLRRPSGQRNPGGFNYRFFLAQRHIFGILYVSSTTNLEIVQAPAKSEGWTILRLLERVRHRVEAVTDQIYRVRYAQVIKAMLLGQRHFLPPDVMTSFQRSGVSHLLAVSGLHVGLIAFSTFFFLGLFRLPNHIACFLTILVVIFYACLVGFRASVLRASIITTLFLVARIIDRDVDLINLLIVTALVLLIANPTQIWDVGFQLSFVATISIVYFIGKWQPAVVNRFQFFIVRWILAGVGASLSAQIGTLPIVAYHFHQFSLISLLTNLSVMVLVTLMVSLALASLVLGLIWIKLAIPTVVVGQVLLWCFLGTVDLFSRFPLAWLEVSAPSYSQICLYVVFILGLTNLPWILKYGQVFNHRSLIWGLLMATILVWDFAWWSPGRCLTVTFLDVSQGDATVIQFPDGKTMLVDGGLRSLTYDNGQRVIAPFLRYRQIRRIDLVVLSHPDNDHGGGMRHILEHFEIGEVLGVPHQNLRSTTHRHLHQIVDRKQIPHRLGQVGVIDLTPTAKIELVYPDQTVDLTDEEINNDSLVLRISYGVVDLLMTGDIEKAAESQIVNSGALLASEVIKVPHHGSKTSSTEAFLDAVVPRFSIFSLGFRNRYGFPAPSVVRRYLSQNCQVLRTDLSGAITFRTDGQRIWFDHFISP